MPELVECHSGTEYAEDPRRFFWEGEWRKVIRVVVRRRMPDGKQFVVEEERHELFVLTFDPERGEWMIRPGTS
jgi:hypothetical protein